MLSYIQLKDIEASSRNEKTKVESLPGLQMIDLLECMVHKLNKTSNTKTKLQYYKSLHFLNQVPPLTASHEHNTTPKGKNHSAVLQQKASKRKGWLSAQIRMPNRCSLKNKQQRQ